MPEIPLWVKSPDYDRVDWLNKFISDMWPFLDKAICSIIRSTAEPMFAEYLVDLHVFAAPRVTLKPLVPTIPCFANMVVSLMEKPYIDFGINVLGGDIMSIPGLYRYVQERIKKEANFLYLWPKSLEIPVLDASTVAIMKPVGILHVKVVRATKLLKMDLLGLSDPYVKLSLSGEKLSTKKTTVKKKTLNPEWNEDFKLSVKEPQSQMLLVNVFDWDKVGSHDRLGTQTFPLKLLTPNEPREATLDLLKDTNVTDPRNKKQRGRIVLELIYAPFREDSDGFSGLLDGYTRKDSVFDRAPSNLSQTGTGLLLVTVQGAHDVEGSRHNNPYVLVIFRGETKKSKMVRKTRNPLWNEEFQFLLEEPPLQEKIHIKESLGHVDINLADVVHNGRINQKYHLIDSKNGVIHVELRWKMI
ncbi:synaptotagmin-3 [Phtheirospermum japonicum]|uniref:Synaptotagmin-3 n=1 Tax=Phtheirospermum japonicum TaxID=374723 RepID=A0A830CG12_9LAMI|nr:synaptotagmin-3 [Phtheirospermum japonicum]